MMGKITNVMTSQTTLPSTEPIREAKPLLRGWFHAIAAVAAVALTVVLCVLSRKDLARLISMLIFGLCMIELYMVSALYHIGSWQGASYRRLRALDHANIFLLIAGTYTPLCFNILTGWVRSAILIAIWGLAVLGVGATMLTLRLPRWVSTVLYVAMGWMVLLALPAFLTLLPWVAVAMLVGGGVLYTIGAVIYMLRWPNPFPRVLGFHELFHLFVIAGSIAFAASIYLWALPFPRG
jgi:hemolysin III